MAYFNKFRGTKGFISTWERVIRFKYMISEIAKEMKVSRERIRQVEESSLRKLKEALQEYNFKD